jgi:hypothetical protein
VTHRLHQLLALLLLPEHEHRNFLSQVSDKIAAAIAQECELEDEVILELIAEAVCTCLDE